MAKQGKTIQVTQIKSSIGLLQNQKKCLMGLGLRRIRHSVQVEDTAANRGMINKVQPFVTVKES